MSGLSLAPPAVMTQHTCSSSSPLPSLSCVPSNADGSDLCLGVECGRGTCTGGTCACPADPNLVGEFCESCGAHGVSNGTFCACTGDYTGSACEFAPAYTLSGCSVAAQCGTFVRTTAACNGWPVYERAARDLFSSGTGSPEGALQLFVWNMAEIIGCSGPYAWIVASQGRACGSAAAIESEPIGSFLRAALPDG